MHYVPLALPLWLLYLALTGNVEPSNLVVGLLLALGIARLLRPDPRPPDLRRAPSALFGLLRYVGILSVEVVQNGLVVARIVLSPSLPIRPAIIAIPSLARSELGTALSAHWVTLTPGELVVEIGDDGTMYTHVLDIVRSEEAAAAAQRERLSLLRQLFGRRT